VRRARSTDDARGSSPKPTARDRGRSATRVQAPALNRAARNHRCGSRGPRPVGRRSQRPLGEAGIVAPLHDPRRTLAHGLEPRPVDTESVTRRRPAGAHHGRERSGALGQCDALGVGRRVERSSQLLVVDREGGRHALGEQGAVSVSGRLILLRPGGSGEDRPRQAVRSGRCGAHVPRPVAGRPRRIARGPTVRNVGSRPRAGGLHMTSCPPFCGCSSWWPARR
jgi:hypothetical protein